MRWIIAVMVLMCFGLSSAHAKTKGSVRETYAAGGKLTQTCDKLCTSSLTGKSPWLVMGLGGAYQFYEASGDEEARKNLGWFGQPIVFGPILFLVALLLCKDFLLTWMGFLKAPLNALGEVMHASGGVLAILYLGDSASTWGVWQPAAAEYVMVSETVPEFQPTNSNSVVLQSLLFLGMCIVHTAVWIVFNSVEVAIILNPFPFVDGVLKALRTTVIGVITAAVEIHPVLGALLAAPIVLGCILLIPFAIRFTTLGWVFSMDTLKRLFTTRTAPTGPVRAFAWWSIPQVRLFTYGHVEVRDDGIVEFVYRRFFILNSCRRELPRDPAVALGTLTSALVNIDATHGTSTWLRLPPRYCGYEQAVAAQLRLTQIVDAKFTTSIKQTWQRLKNACLGAKTVTA